MLIGKNGSNEYRFMFCDEDAQEFNHFEFVFVLIIDFSCDDILNVNGQYELMELMFKCGSFDMGISHQNKKSNILFDTCLCSDIIS